MVRWEAKMGRSLEAYWPARLVGKVPDQWETLPWLKPRWKAAEKQHIRLPSPLHMPVLSCAHVYTSTQMYTHAFTQKTNSMRKGGNILRLKACLSSNPLPASSALQQNSLNGYQGKHLPAVPSAMIRNCCSLSQYIRNSNSTSGPGQYRKGSARSVLHHAAPWHVCPCLKKMSYNSSVLAVYHVTTVTTTAKRFDKWAVLGWKYPKGRKNISYWKLNTTSDL